MNSNGSLSLLTKLFVKEAQYAQITKSEALIACGSVLCQLDLLKEEYKEYLLDALIRNKILIPSSLHVYFIHDNSTQGILSDFTSCYSPLCKTSKSSCYSPCCPNKPSFLSSTDQNSDEWTSSIPRYILCNLSPRERKRQLAIEELKDYEDHFVKQLKIIKDMFSYPLLLSQTIIEESRKESFHNTLFGNYRKLSSHHRKLTKTLDSIRDSSFLFPDSTTIGHILYDHFTQLQDLYICYVSNHARSKYIYALEHARNVAFSTFIQHQQAMERDIRLPLKDLLVTPIVRIGKYELLFTTIVKHSKEDDRDPLTNTIRLVREILHNINEAARESESEVRLIEIRANLKLRRRHLTLSDDATLLMEGPMHLVSIQPTPCHLFLFSNELYMTRTRTNTYGETEYIALTEKPIPLAMLDISKPARLHTLLLHRKRWHSEKRADSIRHRILKKIRNRDLQKSASLPVRNTESPRLLQLCHRADPHVTYTFECENYMSWKKKIRAVLDHTGPFALSLICSTWNYSHLQSLNGRYATGCGTIYCSLPFTTSDGRDVIALGTQYGLWVAYRDGSEVFKQVLSASCHQLELFQNKVLIVRCVHPRRILGAILIDQLLTSATSQMNILQKSRVLCFVTSTLKNDSILVYLRKRRTGSYRLVLLRYFTDGSSPYFKKHKEHKTVLLEPKDLKVIDEHVYIRSPTEGVEKVSLVSWILGKPNTSYRIELPHAHSSEDQGLLTVSYVPLNQPNTAMICSAEYAYPVAEEKDTDSLQQGIEFEAKAKCVAVSYPYLIIFSSHVIEIRHLETTELVQVISGNHIRCIYVSQKDRNSSPIIHVSMIDTEQDKTHVHQLYLKEPILVDE